MQARHLVTALAVLAAGTFAVGPASAAPKPKPFKGSKTVSDNTADPTGSGTDGSDCSSMLPTAGTPLEDAPTPIKVPGLGKLKIQLKNTGDWALEVRDPKGIIIGSSDGGTPEIEEQTTVKTKKKGTYNVWACNLGGAPTATMTWSWTPA